MPIDWKPLVEIVHAHQRFVLTSHVRPDADAIGSEIGMAGILESLGKSVRIINPSATPDHLAFLDPDKKVQKLGEGVTVEQACDTDVHMILDTSAWAQLNDLRRVIEKTPARKIVVDHHVSSDNLGATEFKDESASATGVLVKEFADVLGVRLSIPNASAVFAAIATDTGWFRFPNADVRTLTTAAQLVELGVQPAVLYRDLYEKSSLARLKLHGRVLSRVSVECGGRLAYTWVEQKDFVETGSHPTDTEDLVNDCLTIQGTECAFIVVEQKSGQAKCSFRSRTGLNVAKIAEQFGGGGHKQAAGAMLAGPFPKALETVLKTIKTDLGCTEEVAPPPPASNG
jgi:phosphoesterase RecJ-like protein